MTDSAERTALPQLRSGPLITGAVLVGTGAMLVLAGFAVGGAHLFSVTRRWVEQMEVPPRQLGQQQWSRARAAAAAGTRAWQNEEQAAEAAHG
ncbi:MAG TPA: hypothetical protein VIX86_01275 [Streptosporangiaceae bacterium]